MSLKDIEETCNDMKKFLGKQIFKRNTWLAISGVLNIYLIACCIA